MRIYKNIVKFILIGSIGALAGCALLGKSDPVVPRYFTPMDDSQPVPAAKPAGHLELRLGHVEGWSHLREPMVVRNSAQELTYKEESRWTERPEVYLRRALAVALFGERGITEVMSGRAVTLDVELAAFEEIAQPQDRVRLQAFYTVRDERLGLLQETITVEQPVQNLAGADHMQAVVAAFSQALHAGTEQIADKVAAKLSELSAK